MMSSVRTFGVIVLLLSSTAAHAASITNRDERGHKVTIIEFGKTADHVLQPSQTLTGVCEKGCIVRLNESERDEFRLAANDALSIEDGTVYFEGADAPARSAPAPAPSKKRGNRG